MRSAAAGGKPNWIPDRRGAHCLSLTTFSLFDYPKPFHAERPAFPVQHLNVVAVMVVV